MADSITAEKSFKFAVRVINLYKFLVNEKREYVMSKQLLRSGTSIGANVREALQAQSKRDFLNKINIALKEANETQYWIELLCVSDYISKKQKESIWIDSDEIIRLLVTITKTTKRNIKNEE